MECSARHEFKQGLRHLSEDFDTNGAIRHFQKSLYYFRRQHPKKELAREAREPIMRALAKRKELHRKVAESIANKAIEKAIASAQGIFRVFNSNPGSPALKTALQYKIIDDLMKYPKFFTELEVEALSWQIQLIPSYFLEEDKLIDLIASELQRDSCIRRTFFFTDVSIDENVNRLHSAYIAVKSIEDEIEKTTKEFQNRFAKKTPVNRFAIESYKVRYERETAERARHERESAEKIRLFQLQLHESCSTCIHTNPYPEDKVWGSPKGTLAEMRRMQSYKPRGCC